MASENGTTAIPSSSRSTSRDVSQTFAAPAGDALGSELLKAARRVAAAPNLEGKVGGVTFNYGDPNFISFTARIPVSRVAQEDGSEIITPTPFLQQ